MRVLNQFLVWPNVQVLGHTIAAHLVQPRERVLAEYLRRMAGRNKDRYPPIK